MKEKTAYNLHCNKKGMDVDKIVRGECPEWNQSSIYLSPIQKEDQRGEKEKENEEE